MGNIYGGDLLLLAMALRSHSHLVTYLQHICHISILPLSWIWKRLLPSWCRCTLRLVTAIADAQCNFVTPSFVPSVSPFVEALTLNIRSIPAFDVYLVVSNAVRIAKTSGHRRPWITFATINTTFVLLNESQSMRCYSTVQARRTLTLVYQQTSLDVTVVVFWLCT